LAARLATMRDRETHRPHSPHADAGVQPFTEPAAKPSTIQRWMNM